MKKYNMDTEKIEQEIKAALLPIWEKVKEIENFPTTDLRVCLSEPEPGSIAVKFEAYLHNQFIGYETLAGFFERIKISPVQAELELKRRRLADLQNEVAQLETRLKP